MNRNSLLIFLFLVQISFHSTAQDAYEQCQERTKWFREARFGMFIHWGGLLGLMSLVEEGYIGAPDQPINNSLYSQ